eukprot:Nitzschia sp. Nitz4//scaffold60_size111251//46888//47997//NITZ4_004147-RA/size111251-processed-gene-0.25-mRNA-1//1//CDS//3329555564//6455//frame0
MTDVAIRYEQRPILQSVCAYGSETRVPNNEICRLSYYLKCCVVGCGINIGIEEELLDYMHAHCMTSEQQKKVLEYAFGTLNVANLMDRAFILDEQHVLLPQGTLNTFYELKTASTYFSINRFLSVATGQQLYVHKVMLCTLKWMREYYLGPFIRYQQGNPIVEIMATPVAEGDELSYVVVEQEGRDDNLHSHGVIVTTIQPPLSLGSSRKCRSCDKRFCPMNEIFYRCTQCTKSEYCESCYEQGCHDQTHVFERICRTSAEALPVQVEVLNDVDETFVPDVPVAIAIPVERIAGVKRSASRSMLSSSSPEEDVAGKAPWNDSGTSRFAERRANAEDDGHLKPAANKRLRRNKQAPPTTSAAISPPRQLM